MASRFIIGIDLGTTNSALAAADRSAAADDAPAEIRVMPIPQLVAPREVDARGTLPSFLYFPTDAERAGGEFDVPGAGPDRDRIAGVLARDRGALVPGRLVSSAKSWLAYGEVDRTAPILPWGSAGIEGAPACSPVEASAAYLRHLREAWNRARPNDRLEDQEVVLAVPASFDEEARELTVTAAHDAGIPKLTLVEEPLAGFYAWTSEHRGRLAAELRDGEIVLVCDVGGGTSDFTLVRVAIVEGRIEFERIAIGSHLLLGGDNVDLAIARLVESRLGVKLSIAQRSALERRCASIKERLLSDPSSTELPVTVLGTGRGVVAASATTTVSRQDVEQVLGRFLPMVEASARPQRDGRVALREIGLPYASDPAITRHLAAFLESAVASGAPASAAQPSLARPDAVLFNGGFFTPEAARAPVVNALAAWFDDGSGWRPRVLTTASPESAVARGAVSYGLARPGAGLRVKAGSARAYYIGVAGGGAGRARGVCVMPRGTDEGTRLELDETFRAVTNQPVSFTLYSTPAPPPGANRLGAIVEIDEERFHRHAPLVTVLRFGKRSRHSELPVRLAVEFTPVGTLEIWAESISSEHRWRLRFELRRRSAAGEERPADVPSTRRAGANAETAATAAQETAVVVSEDAIAAAEARIREVFVAGGGGSPEALPAKLEEAIGIGKAGWPLPLARRLGDLLLGLGDGRRLGPRYESRWLNLLGYCLRPGFGAARDEWRIAEARRIYAAGLVFPKDVQCQAEWLILWGRVAAGFTPGQQRDLFVRYASELGLRGKKRAGRVNPQIEREGIRLLASLEHVAVADRVALGDELIARLQRDPMNTALLWAVGRLGTRVPLYAPINQIVPPHDAVRWIHALLSLRRLTPEAGAAIVQIGALTGDPARDIDEAVIAEAIARIETADLPVDVTPLRTVTRADRLRAGQIFGESLPEGLRI